VAEKGMAVLEAVATETPVGGGGRRRMRAFHDKETSLPRCESEIHAVFAALLLNQCKPNFDRGLGVYVPRSVDWHPA